jgi:hypothetical protein
VTAHDDEIARDKAARDALEVLCARHRCEWALDLTAPRPTVTLHRRGVVIGRVAGDTLADAVRAHEEVLAGTVPDRGSLKRGAIEDVPHHPLLAGAYRTKRLGETGAAVHGYLDAALADPQGVAVRMWGFDLAKLRPRDIDDAEREALVMVRNESPSVIRGALRPWTARRALDELEACGLVTKSGGRWCVTAHGREIAEEMGR